MVLEQIKGPHIFIIRRNDMKVRDLLSSRKKWTQRNNFVHTRNEKGSFNKPYIGPPDDTCRFCLEGAIRFCYKGEDRRKVLAYVTKKLGMPITTFNDSNT